jgi:hypothetical protein
MNYSEAISALENIKASLKNTSELNFLSRLYYLDGQSRKTVETIDTIRKDWSVIFTWLAYEDLGKHQ